MDFSEYKDFRLLINTEYGRFYKKYPYATLVLDYFIQLKAAKQQGYFQKWLSESQIDSLFFVSVTKITSMRYSSKIYYWYLYIASYFIDRTDSYLIHNSLGDFNFPGIRGLLRSVAKNNKWFVVEQWSGSTNRKSLANLLLLKQLSPYRCFISFRTKKELKKLRHSDDSLLLFFLNNESYMEKLEVLVKKDVERTQKLIEKLGINLFINSGDSSAEGRVLNKACEKMPINNISFAHGYIQATNLLGVAPVRSSKFIVWTKEQKEDMDKVLSLEQSNKIEYIGFPKDYDKPKQDLELKYDHCLMVMTYIRPILKDKNLLDIFEKTILDLKKFTKFITIRLHPHERKGSRMISIEELEEIDFYIDKWGLELSNSDLKTDFNSSDFVIGCSTSTLVEALAAGKRTYDIEELSRPGIEFKKEGVIRIKANQIVSIPKISNQSQEDNQLQYSKMLLSINLTRMIQKFIK